MNPLIRKELRLLFPAWVVALLTATLPVWVGRDYENASQVVFGATVFFLGLSSFGQEMTFGTFSLLLVQPEHRRRWWNIKAGLSAAALLSALSIEELAWLIRGSFYGSTDLRPVLGACAMTTVVAYAGGLWAALLVRDMIGAFFLSFLTPLATIWAIFLGFSHWISTDDPSKAIIWVLSAYSVAGFWFGRRLFLRAQDIPWTGGMRALPAAWSAPARWLSTGFPQKCSPWRAFARKEFQQQEAAVVLFVFLALGHLAAIGARHFYPGHSSVVRGFLDLAWIFWLILPMAAGSVAVAEERRLRTHEVGLCVPFSMRDQFALKLAMVLVVGIGLGGVVPYLLESGASAIGLGGDTDLWALRTVLLLGATGIALLSFYASTLTNRVVPALATVVCMAIGMGGALDVASNLFGTVPFWRRTIFICMEWPVMTATLVWLAYRNYKAVRAGWRIWLGNLGCAVAVFISVALLAGGIYNRAWELVMPLEPQHGAARIAGPGYATLVDSKSGPAVLLPDGRLWIGERAKNLSSTISGAFGPGSNWVNLAATRDGAAAIKADGTLWNVSDAARIDQIGTDSDWQKVVGSWNVFYALKRNGTVWDWGRVPSSHPQSSSVPYVADPARIGEDATWVDIFASHERVSANGVKSDGTISELVVMPGRTPGPARQILHSEFRPLQLGLAGINWTSLEGWGGLGGLELGFVLGIRTDGTLWVGGDIPGGIREVFGNMVQKSGRLDTAVRVGDKSDWVQLSASGVHMVALESDGAISVMESRGFLRTWHPSKYRDWIGVAAEFQDVWALAADGTLYCWEENTEEWNRGNFDLPIFERRPFLRVTRKPVLAVNILDSK